MLGIIFALDYEIEWISQFKDLNFKLINKQKFYFNNKIVITFCGVGKVNAAISTLNLFNNFNITQILNIGSCCTTNPLISILDVILVDSSQYGDVDVSIDSKYDINQIPYEIKYFKSNSNFNDKVTEILFKLNINVKKGNFITIDSFLTKDNSFKFNEINNPDILGIDMELAAIAQTCNHYNINFSALKIVSDNINIDNNHDEFLFNINSIAKLTKDIIMAIFNEFDTK